MSPDDNPYPNDQAGALVGREIIAQAAGTVIDISVELAARPGRGDSAGLSAFEPPDKTIIALRADARKATTGPQHLRLESGAARQLAATLLRAANLADDID